MTTNNPELDAAWSAEPHLENIRIARGRLLEARRGLAAPAGVGGVRDEVTELVLAGESVPVDLVERVGSAAGEEEAFNRASMLLTEVSRAVQDRERQIRARAAHSGLARLHERVVEIVEGAREAEAVLGGVVTAEAALEAGARATEAWRSLASLAEQYRQVRDAQRTMMSALVAAGVSVPGTLEFALRVFGEVRGYRELWPGWRSAGAEGAGLLGDVRTTIPGQEPPWPHHPDGSPTRDVAFLLWAAAEEVNPLWVPSVAEIQKAHAGPDREPVEGGGAEEREGGVVRVTGPRGRRPAAGQLTR